MLWMNNFYDTSSVRRNQWSPRCDFHESGESHALNIEVPGASRGDISINVSDRLLTVEAKRNIGRGDQTWKGQWLISDRLNADRIQARLDSGILCITFAKVNETKSRNIEIE
jgi:HSP20 family protein